MITDIRDFTPPHNLIPKIFFVVYLLKLSSECLVSYDPHFPANDGTNKIKLDLDSGLESPTNATAIY